MHEFSNDFDLLISVYTTLNQCTDYNIFEQLCIFCILYFIYSPTIQSDYDVQIKPIFFK